MDARSQLLHNLLLPPVFYTGAKRYQSAELYQVLSPQVQVQVQVPKPQVRVQVQVLRPQVQLQVQVPKS